jgi:peptidoglycan/xylan/chitin deacetylase (PgdA/CDA1 family)
MASNVAGFLRDEDGALVLSGRGTAPALSPGAQRSKETVLTSLQAGHGFAKSGGTGPAGVDDTAKFIFGSQSYKTTTTSDNTNTSWRKTGLTAVDLSAKTLVVTLRCDDLANLFSAKLYLSSDNMAANFGYVECLASGATYRPVMNGEWVTLTLPVPFTSPAWTVTGAPSAAAINSIQLSCQGQNGVAVDVWWNLVSARPLPASGLVSVTCDDGWLSQYTEVRKKMDQYRFPWTIYPICDRIDAATAGTDAQWMTLPQLQELRDVHNVEVGVHAYSKTNHDLAFPALTSAALESELTSARGWLTRNGFWQGVDHLAYPLGAYDLTNVLPLARKYFRSARTVTLYNQESFLPYDPHRLRVYAVSNTTTALQVQTEIDRAIAQKTWLILLFHKIVTAPALSTDFSIANFGTVVDYLASSGANVKTVGDVLRQDAP